MPKSLFESTNESDVSYQKKCLQAFLNDLKNHKAIMCHELTEKLLKSNEGKTEELELTFTVEKTKKAPINVKDMIHFTGIVSIRI